MSNYYKLITESYCVYILKVEGKQVYRVGSTNKLQWRIYQISQGSYENYLVHRVFHFSTKEESRKFENSIHKILRKSGHHLKGSFYKSLSIDYEHH